MKTFLKKSRENNLEEADTALFKDNTHINKFYFRSSVKAILVVVILYDFIAQHFKCVLLVGGLTLIRLPHVEDITTARKLDSD